MIPFDHNVIDIPACRIGTAQLVTAPSYLIDRFVPDCEVVVLPPKAVAGGTLRFGPGSLAAPKDGRGRLARLRGPRARRPAPEGAVFDFRLRTPQNWAHFLNNHLPIFFVVAEALGLDWAEATLVTPANTPSYIRSAAALFGLRLLATDDILEGTGIVFWAEPWTSIRPARADWVRSPRVAAAVAAATEPGRPPLPARVFLSRRATRALSNEAEVAAWLGVRGFETLYPEDLDAADQFRLFREAEIVVAIHGAGLAPLLYRAADWRLGLLVEILPCGHMTDVYRVMAEQVGCRWIGVRGRIKPKYVQPAYRLGAGFGEFSLDEFEVDTRSLETAFTLAGLDATTGAAHD